MKISSFMLLLPVMLLALSRISAIVAEDAREQQVKKTYIIHMDKSEMPASFEDDHFQWYDSSLKSVSSSADMLYTYKTIIHGFATRLTAEEAELLGKQSGILSVLPERRYELHTTRTPEFLGLGKSEALLPASGKVSEVIVGVVDTGVWPELKSYDDTGLAAVPSGWKGVCEAGTNFSSSNCNRKLIGARFFSKGYEATVGPIDVKTESKSPRDDDGHGTHTSSTATGSAVSGASLFGYASGTARGMAPQARLAAYKACWLGGCFGSDITAAMEKAVEDGVDVLSLSIGGSQSEYYRDTVAIGAFSAAAQGILVSCSAGNGGPEAGSLSNVAPWITTVGAGTLDRDFPAFVNLGSAKKYRGISLYRGTSLSRGLLPLVYAGNASVSSSGGLCAPESLTPSKVAGKIVVCDRGGTPRVQKSLVVKKAGGLGMILTNTDAYGEELVADAYLLPTAAVGAKAGAAIKSYIASQSNPTGTIALGDTELDVQPSPVVASFSSRGPNLVTPEILKPDLIAPGVNILAGWTGAIGPTGLTEDKRHVTFNIISGTSMSCPHVSGLAALVKAAHPEWSPAAIKSALMTTSYTAYKTGETIIDVASGNPATPFDYGAGHVDPMAALDPGLVYDNAVEDYFSFLCALNYSSTEIKLTTHRDFTCDTSKKYRLGDFNYPSFAVPLETSSGTGGGTGASTTVKYTRTLTNVGTPGTYKVTITSQAPSVKISVEPQSLTFSQAYEKKTYTVTFVAGSSPSGTSSFARLVWSDGKRTNRVQREQPERNSHICQKLDVLRLAKIETMRMSVFILPVALALLLLSNISAIAEDEKEQQMKKTYIIHMDKSNMPASFEDDHFRWYGSSLKLVSDSADMLYTYTNVIHGFSARLTLAEAVLLEKQPGTVSVLPELRYELQTTRTPEFLGISGKHAAVFPGSVKVSDVVIGVVDSGVWPESKSYDDKSLGPVPRSWKGKCEEGKNFNSSSCNRKLIGARFFSRGYEAGLGHPMNETKESRSPRDDDGHGTHTSTTAAWSPVPGASLFGYASGTAKGMATQARVATYKVCWLSGCFSSDILAAMDKAVEDGIITDGIDIGAFSVVAKGIFVSCAAGNQGPFKVSSSNNAPWITTVGAGTLDRDFPAYVSLGNRRKYRGISVYGGTSLPSGLLPLIYGSNGSNLCIPDSLVPAKVAGKIVVCDQGENPEVEKGAVVKRAGGVGMILADAEINGEELIADVHLLATIMVGHKAGKAIKRYIASQADPKAHFAFGKTQLGVEPSPVVAAFSSRGPNPVSPSVLKPDLIAPGVNILAGWTGAVGPTRLDDDTMRVSFNILSGTSMSCPHVSGLAAILKAAHPKWSPAAIKSALMTTSYTTYKNGKTIKDIATGNAATPYDYGAGHVDPVAAIDPGLVYDLAVKDYLSFLCALHYTTTDIKKLTHRDFTCDSSKNYSVGDLNYPSFSVDLYTNSNNGGAGTEKYTRTLTNVGPPARYNVSVSIDSTLAASVKILVEPKSLSFSQAYEKKTYTVTFVTSSMPSGTDIFARLVWSDGKHIVSSPIAISWF
ncbi:hypothetical protein ACFX2C_043247 [Malus domestica]